MALPCAALIAGFFVFVEVADRIEPQASLEAEGVVALTGGPDRIAEAVDLLAGGHADRLLITGVNQSTPAAEIARLTPRFRSLFACCIDLGYHALNTTGNAAETRDWARAHGMKSLIIVTSKYHMPRALFEIAKALPDVQLLPFPVESEPWTDPLALRMLASEYVKYIAAVARTRLISAPDEPNDRTLPNRMRNGRAAARVVDGWGSALAALSPAGPQGGSRRGDNAAAGIAVDALPDAPEKGP